MRKLLIAVPFLILANISAFAQFNSGSTGADGALDLSSCENTCYVQLPESGILNYTTVNIPTGKTLRFRKNLLNTPVIILAMGNVTIAGTIAVDGESTNPPFYEREPGPGGYSGGAVGQDGMGPGGGKASGTPGGGRNAIWIGNVLLVPVTGGSGGSGGWYNGGGGGGGAIVIASSASISIIGAVSAGGQNGQCCGQTSAGGGAGGAIRLVANSISGSGMLLAPGGTGPGGPGVIRLEAQNGQVTFTGTTNPTAVVAPINSVIIQPNQATLKIITVGPYAVSPYAMGRPDRIDVLLPTNLPDPISIGVEGANIPSGTEVQFVVSGAGTATPCTLTGGGTMTCTGSISGLSRVGISTIMAYVIYPPPPSLAKFNPKGENHVAKVRLESRLGAASKFLFLNKKGREIAVNKLNPKFLKEFGM